MVTTLASRSVLIDLALLSDLVRPARTPIASAWARLSLAHKFLAAASVVVTCGMLLVGSWVAGWIEAGVVHNAAATAALYIDNAIKPHVQAPAAAAAGRSVKLEDIERA